MANTYDLICEIKPGPVYGYCYLYLFLKHNESGKKTNLLDLSTPHRCIPRTAKVEEGYIYGKVSTINKVIQNLLWDWKTITLELNKSNE